MRNLMGQGLLLTALCFGALLPQASFGETHTLWSSRAEPCRIEVTNEHGGIRITPGDTLRLTSTLAGLSAQPTAGAEAEQLEIHIGDTSGEADVVLEAPTGCEIKARTLAGPVRVESRHLDAPLDIRSQTGELHLQASPRSDIAIQLATSGEITVDFTVEIEVGYHQEPAKKGHLILGSGSTPIQLESLQGKIFIQRVLP